MPDALIPETPLVRRRDGEATRQAILQAALQEFSDHGLSGARVDAIVARSGSNVRMIYHYFGSKEALFAAVLEQAYRGMREAEQHLQLGALEPAEAMRVLCGFVFDYHEANPRYSRLVCVENIHRAKHLAGLDGIQSMNRTILQSLEDVLRRGRQARQFRMEASAWDVHLLMTSFCFFRVANSHTLGAVFGRDTLAPRTRRHHRRMIADAVLGYLQAHA